MAQWVVIKGSGPSDPHEGQTGEEVESTRLYRYLRFSDGTCRYYLKRDLMDPKIMERRANQGHVFRDYWKKDADKGGA